MLFLVLACSMPGKNANRFQILLLRVSVCFPKQALRLCPAFSKQNQKDNRPHFQSAAGESFQALLEVTAVTPNFVGFMERRI